MERKRSGRSLAAMTPTVGGGSERTDDLRWAVRADSRSGYLFLTTYQPARLPQVGTRTPVLADDGADGLARERIRHQREEIGGPALVRSGGEDHRLRNPSAMSVLMVVVAGSDFGRDAIDKARDLNPDLILNVVALGDAETFDQSELPTILSTFKGA